MKNEYLQRLQSGQIKVLNTLYSEIPQHFEQKLTARICQKLPK
jgi:hypothetical protein